MSQSTPLVSVDVLNLNPPLKITRIKSSADFPVLQDFFDRCGGITGWDIETTPLKDYFYRRERTLQFGNMIEQYVIDLLDFCDRDSDLLYAAQGEYGKHLHKAPKLKELLDFITPVVCTDKYLKVGVNLSFEYMSFYWLFGLRTYHFWDCAVVEKCIWAGAHSMKDYGFFSMEDMMARYFQVQIDKKYQESFTLDAELCDEQIAYAALDTRFPIALRNAQMLVLEGKTYKGMVAAGMPKAAQVLKYIDPIVTGDDLRAIADVENNCIGAFQDMHVHGERLDRDRWMTRVAERVKDRADLVANVLDPIFIPLVGKKTDLITDEQIEASKAKWKVLNKPTDTEIELKVKLKAAKRNDPESVPALEIKLQTLEQERKELKEALKKESSELGKRRTKIKNLAAVCEGEALINYGSDAQLLAVITTLRGLKNVKNMDDETLEKYENIAVMAAIRKYHGLAKEVGTYGTQWATEWVTKPCKEEGWLHPGDGRLHCVFNQYDAETGRSSSEKPNGQNLPQDKEIRECFIADAPDESIRISDCCDVEVPDPGAGWVAQYGYGCPRCGKPCTTHPEEYVIITADMSGAELRIIAELADDPLWIGAFERDEDVHSVGTELLHEEDWPKGTLRSLRNPNGWTLKDCKEEVVLVIQDSKGKDVPIGPCAYFALKENGEPARKKCKCPDHQDSRNSTKAVNFLLAYGGGPTKLAQQIKKALQVAKDLMAKHEQKNPRIWAYLAESGRKAKLLKKSFDMFGRRRLFPEPTWDRAKEKAKEDNEERMALPFEQVEANVLNFFILHKRKPTKEELWILSHRLPTNREISKAFQAMHGSIERQGKNHSIQGTNASIAKVAMGAGRDKNGEPFLWHALPLYKAILIKFVHDELVVQCPKHYAKTVAALIGDAFKRAAAERMRKVVMESEHSIDVYWKK